AAKREYRKDQGGGGTQHSRKHFTPPSYAPRRLPPAPQLAGYRLAADAARRRTAAWRSPPSTAATTGATLLRRPRGTEMGASAMGSSAMLSGRKPKTRTGRAIFLTVCSPRSSNG